MIILIPDDVDVAFLILKNHLDSRILKQRTFFRDLMKNLHSPFHVAFKILTLSLKDLSISKQARILHRQYWSS